MCSDVTIQQNTVVLAPNPECRNFSDTITGLNMYTPVWHCTVWYVNI